MRGNRTDITALARNIGSLRDRKISIVDIRLTLVPCHRFLRTSHKSGWMLSASRRPCHYSQYRSSNNGRVVTNVLSHLATSSQDTLLGVCCQTKRYITFDWSSIDFQIVWVPFVFNTFCALFDVKPVLKYSLCKPIDYPGQWYFLLSSSWRTTFALHYLVLETVSRFTVCRSQRSDV